MSQAVDRAVSHRKKGDIAWIRKEMNFLKHCLVNMKSRMAYAEKQMAKAVAGNPHVIVGCAEDDCVGLSREIMKAMYERVGKSAPAHVLVGIENQVKRVVDEFMEAGSARNWQLALVFEFDGENENRQIRNWMPVVVPNL